MRCPYIYISIGFAREFVLFASYKVTDSRIPSQTVFF
jgi:hypothetical protein